MRVWNAAALLAAGTMMAVAPAWGGSLGLALKGGPHWARVEHDGPSSENFEGTLQFGGGLGLSIPLSPAATIDLDVLYVRKGSKYASGGSLTSGDSYDYESITRLDYVVAAPMLRITPFPRGVSPFLTVGAEIGYFLSGEAEWERDTAGEIESGTVDLDDSVEDTDVGISFGGGIEFPGRSVTLRLETRYVLGLTNISTGGDPGVEIEQFNRSIYAFAGIGFH